MCVCVCACVSIVCTITFELNNLCPWYLACWLTLTLSRGDVQTQGHSSEFTVIGKNVPFRLWMQLIDKKVKVELEKPVTT